MRQAACEMETGHSINSQSSGTQTKRMKRSGQPGGLYNSLITRVLLGLCMLDCVRPEAHEEKTGMASTASKAEHKQDDMVWRSRRIVQQPYHMGHACTLRVGLFETSSPRREDGSRYPKPVRQNTYRMTRSGDPGELYNSCITRILLALCMLDCARPAAHEEKMDHGIHSQLSRTQTG